MYFIVIANVAAFRNIPYGIFVFAGVAFAANIAWLAWFAARIKWVEVDADYFYVSNFRREIVIPRRDLYEATEMRWAQPYWITLHLRRPSEFGEKIVFIPPWRLGSFWTPNPLVDELNTNT